MVRPGLAGRCVPHPRGLVVRCGDDRRPSGLKLAALTARSWRNGSPSGLPLSASHTRAVCRRRGDDAPAVRAETCRRPVLVAHGSPTGLPLSASHTRAVLSSDAVTIRRPSALKLAARTSSHGVLALSEEDTNPYRAAATRDIAEAALRFPTFAKHGRDARALAGQPFPISGDTSAPDQNRPARTCSSLWSPA